MSKRNQLFHQFYSLEVPAETDKELKIPITPKQIALCVDSRFRAIYIMTLIRMVNILNFSAGTRPAWPCPESSGRFVGEQE